MSRPAVAAVLALAGIFCLKLLYQGLIALPLLRGVLAALVVVASAWALGRRLLGERQGGAAHGLAYLLGLALLCTVGWLLGLLGLLHPLALFLLLVALVPVVVRELVLTARAKGAAAFAPQVLLRGAGIPLGVVLLVSLLAGLPPVSWFDALEYHAALPALYLQEGRVPDLPHNFFSHFPHLFQMSAVWVFALEREAPIAVLHWTGLLALLLGVARLAERLTPGSGTLAAALVVSAQPVARAAISPGIDLHLAALAVFTLDQLLEGEPRGAAMARAAACAGLAAAAKLHGVLVLAMMATLLLVSSRLRRGLGAVRGPLALGLALPLLVAGSFYLRTWVLRGAPLWPLWGGGEENAGWAGAVVEYTRRSGIDGGDLGRLPVVLAGAFFSREGWNPAVLAGLVGAWLSGLAQRFEARVTAAAAGVLLLGWVGGARVERYALPWMAILAALGAAGAVAWLKTTGAAAARVLRASLIAPLVVAALATAIDLDAGRDFLVYLSGRESTDAYLERAVPLSPHAVLRRASTELAADARVASFDDPRLFHLWRSWRASSAFDPPLLAAMLRGADDGEEPASRLRAALRAGGFTHVLVNPPYAAHLAREFPQLQRRSLEEDRALRSLLAAHGRMLFTRNGAALFELD